MIGQTISHFHIIEKPPTTSRKNGTPSGQVGKVRKSPTPACLPASDELEWQAGIPTHSVGSCLRSDL
jgi:hypothetical protein